MKRVFEYLFTFLIALCLIGCTQQSENRTVEDQNAGEAGTITNESPDTDVITAEDQKSLTPDQVMDRLKTGNARFMNNDLTPRDYQAQVQKTASGQYPEAVVLSCVDSRVPVEYVFDRGIGDIFVARVAGNFENEDILGSLEFACKVSGSKVIMVLGHERCGAIKAAIDEVELGNITPMLENIEPAVQKVEYEGERTSKNPEFVAKVISANVWHTIEGIRERSPILKEMEENGEIKIVGAVYDLDSGAVEILEEL